MLYFFKYILLLSRDTAGYGIYFAERELIRARGYKYFIEKRHSRNIVFLQCCGFLFVR
jgi:hypothetical protein